MFENIRVLFFFFILADESMSRVTCIKLQSVMWTFSICKTAFETSSHMQQAQNPQKVK